eukprot:Plantae.Rhodophyta-Hildenbrandia_rubra.ctg66140.p1 GENE.Plantae.Rhodophyta-Hildenbrandia_rubra.ctg66140~~Plantae.Rhodophyta-Hildenbrandia_rubra.ctg66140.p1  ORF type:complete len:215 (-),score=14.84 Plantae.Rhodophyta-Hildenbrandia_rubra.ctg66140:155-799(-)
MAAYRQKHPGRPDLEVFEKLFDRLSALQDLVGSGHEDDICLRDALMGSLRSESIPGLISQGYRDSSAAVEKAPRSTLWSNNQTNPMASKNLIKKPTLKHKALCGERYEIPAPIRRKSNARKDFLPAGRWVAKISAGAISKAQKTLKAKSEPATFTNVSIIFCINAHTRRKIKLFISYRRSRQTQFHQASLQELQIRQTPTTIALQKLNLYAHPL